MKGGKRQGAGRPKQDETRVKLSLTLPQEIINWIDLQDGSRSTVIEKALNLLRNRGVI